MAKGKGSSNSCPHGCSQEVDSKQRDQVNRYLKKIEKTDAFLDSAVLFTSMAEEKVKQNIALEIYEDYFDEEDPETNTDLFSAKTAVAFPDPSFMTEGKVQRPVSRLYISLLMLLHNFLGEWN